MNIVGIVAEYNPFHKGHEYHLKKAKENSNCDYVAVVMSGNFVQRGEPALIDKFKRAESAIYGGADLVIELPMPFSCQNAELFAKAALTELKKLNITHLSFGCENNNLELLKEAALIQINNKNLKHIIKEELAKGISYPKALTNAINSISDNEIGHIINSPNNVLGIEYIKSSINLKGNWDFTPVKRIGKNHNDIDLSGKYDSATAIRKSIIDGSNKLYSSSITEKSSEMIKKFYCEYNGFNSINRYLNYIYYKILDLGTNGLNDIYEVSEGLNNKIYSNIFKYNTTDDFIMSLKSKRYTYSKLRRILLNILLNIRKSDIKDFMSTDLESSLSTNNSHNNFIKVLAFNDKGRSILKQSKDSGTYTINKFSDYKKYNLSLDIFNLTNKSTNIYYLPFTNKTTNDEYIQNAIYVK
ncbi:putative nucleotidyltransferase [Sedimentibacter acidaminivorans]|uniref:tRNA(Met) cytidine acetate ligase n=1 Tax=Sedimentibacter acidaminivorans TaxID=913099 RepID=A0ABS4GDP2_9FIRM|nr:nucleotidyltransferase [Sedimentibacter acidaminivorans]MBP1925485.1 putative nucleotidyltransferase [Sedimentibacter acidaminivorans]